MKNDENSLEREFECYAAVVVIEQTFQEIYELMGLDLGSAITTASSAIDVVKKLTDLAGKTQNIELQEGAIELRTQLLAIKEALLAEKEGKLAFKEENLELRQENKALRDQIAKLETSANTITLRDGYYYTSTGNEPVCGACFDAQKKTIRLIRTEDIIRQTLGRDYQCPVCKTRY